MNTRIVLSAAFAASIFCASAPMQAQAPVPSSDQSQRAKITSLQAQVNALQAQVKRLQAQIRASSPTAVAIPNFRVPDFQTLPYQFQPFQSPGINSRRGFQFPGGQGSGQPPQVLPPRVYWNIPPCTATLINQAGR